MLDLSTAVLCDFAQVRDRLLFVSSGAVSRLYRQELPSPLGLMVGLVIEVPLEDAGMEHRLRAEVINRHGTVLATLENLFRVSDAGLFPHEVQQVPLVLSITGVRARTWGTHQVRLYLDDDLVRALTLYVVPAAGPQAVVRTAPTQSRVADDEGSLGGTGTDGVDAPPDGEGQGEPGTEDPAQPLPWGAPVGVPVATEDPAPASDGDEAHEIVMDVVTHDDDPQLVTIVPESFPGASAEPAPADEPAPAPEPVAWDAPSPEAPSPWAAPEPDPATQPVPTTWDPEPAEPASTWAPAPAPTPAPAAAPEPAPVVYPTQPVIAAPRAEEPAYAFDEDDLDADPAHRGRPAPAVAPAEADAEEEPEKSRFSFRYRYDEDEDLS